MSSFESVEKIDSILEWYMIIISVLQATLFQFFTWLYPKDADTSLVMGRIMGLLSTPLILSVLLWIIAVLMKDQEKSVLMKLLVWSMTLPYVLILLFFYSAYVTVGFFQNQPNIRIYLIIIVLAVITGVNVKIVDIIEENYKRLIPNLEIWENQNFVKIIEFVGILLSGAIMILSIV